MKTATQMTEEMQQYYDSEHWYKHYVPGVLYTDGAQYLMTNEHAWLIDLIASGQLAKKVRQNRECQFWYLTRKPNTSSAKIACYTDSPENGKLLYEQNIEYTDTPFEELTLYAMFDEGFGKVVILLPSEY